MLPFARPGGSRQAGLSLRVEDKVGQFKGLGIFEITVAVLLRISITKDEAATLVGAVIPGRGLRGLPNPFFCQVPFYWQ